MKEKRETVFIWPSWICKLVAGEEQCIWKYWMKAHYQLDKKPSSFNLASWTIQHNKLVRTRKAELEKEGWKVLVEGQNSFKRKFEKNGLIYTISGKADLVALKDNDIESGGYKQAKVEDAKTGNQKTSDYVQVVFYMMFLPMCLEQYKDTKFAGTIVYKEGVQNANIPPEAIHDKTMTEEIWHFINLVAGNDENSCDRVPSCDECKRCDIMKKDCPVRVDL